MPSIGHQEPISSSSDFNAQSFLIWSILSGLATCTMVKVVAVTNSGADAPAGYVDILPLVNQIDGAGNVIKHAVIYKCPYFRLIGGANAVILDPQVGDIGLACFASRDISAVSATQDQAPPGSRRMFDMSDGMYVGGFFGQATAQCLRFASDGVHVKSNIAFIVDAPAIQLNGNVTSTGTFTNNSVNIGSTHVHGGVQAGAANSAVPH